ncbi:MAG: permease-like cell division protein FtsX [Gammaproteobacteria bacterium]
MRVMRKEGGARGPSRSRLRAYGLDHLRVLIASLGKLYHAPLSSLLTIAVIGIALALPAGLYVLLLNLQTVTQGWEDASQISLFLDKDTSAANRTELAAQLQSRAEIESLQVITAEEALEEFRAASGFGEALDALGENPLPSVLVAMPAADYREAGVLGKLVEEFRTMPNVEHAQLDMEWLQRLQALVALARNAVVALAIMLGIAVLLVIGNTIRLDIQNRREEIEVVKLIGGTDAFVRRPFLYSGLWYGLIGGCVAWIAVFIGRLALQGPAQRLAGLYDSQFAIVGLGFRETLVLLAGAALLGLLGSWLAVGRHLGEIQPS